MIEELFYQSNRININSIKIARKIDSNSKLSTTERLISGRLENE